MGAQRVERRGLDRLSWSADEPAMSFVEWKSALPKCQVRSADSRRRSKSAPHRVFPRRPSQFLVVKHPPQTARLEGMKRSVVLFVVDSADLPVALRSEHGPIFPIKDLSPLDEPRSVANKLGVESFGEGFSIVDRLGSFELDDRALIIFEGRSLRFDERHASVGATDESGNGTSPQVELILSLIADRLLKSVA